MVSMGLYAYYINKISVYFVKVFQVIGSKLKSEVSLEDEVYIMVSGVNTCVHFLKDDKMKSKFWSGLIYSVMMVYLSKKYNSKNVSYSFFYLWVLYKGMFGQILNLIVNGKVDYYKMFKKD